MTPEQSAAIARIRVKPLEWREGTGGWWFARGAMTSWEVGPYKGRICSSGNGSSPSGDYESIEAAKQAIQAGYEKLLAPYLYAAPLAQPDHIVAQSAEESIDHHAYRVAHIAVSLAQPVATAGEREPDYTDNRAWAVYLYGLPDLALRTAALVSYRTAWAGAIGRDLNESIRRNVDEIVHRVNVVTGAQPKAEEAGK